MQPPFQDAYSYFNDARQAAMPSPESLDRAAARLRSRVDTQQRAQDQQAADQFAGRGQSNSGGYDYARAMNRYGAQQAYATGLADTEDNYDKQRQAGAQILGTLGSQYGQTAGQEGDYQNNQYQAQTQRAGETASSLNNFLTFMGTFGNVTGNPLFDQIFTSGKLGFMNLLGMPTGTSESPRFYNPVY